MWHVTGTGFKFLCALVSYFENFLMNDSLQILYIFSCFWFPSLLLPLFSKWLSSHLKLVCLLDGFSIKISSNRWRKSHVLVSQILEFHKKKCDSQISCVLTQASSYFRVNRQQKLILELYNFYLSCTFRNSIEIKIVIFQLENFKFPQTFF